MRFARADASILAIRMRPNVVSSASSSHERRNTSNGSRKEPLPKSSDPASLAAAFVTDEGRSDGRSRPWSWNRAPNQLSVLSGLLRNSASRHVYSS